MQERSDNPLEHLPVTTVARALRAVTHTTLALRGKFLVLVSIAPLCPLPLHSCINYRHSAVPWPP